jgi:hypothetical protein
VALAGLDGQRDTIDRFEPAEMPRDLIERQARTSHRA